MFEKLKGHSQNRKRIAGTHDNLTGQHSEVVERGLTGLWPFVWTSWAKLLLGHPSNTVLPLTQAIVEVGTLWSPHYILINLAAYLPNQHLRRILMPEFDDSLLEAAKQSKLGTLEGYGEICALSHALQAVGTNLMEFRPPKEILARPLKDGEARVYVEGQWRVVNRDGDVLPEYPPGFSFATLPTLITFSDQGPSNTAQKHPDEEEEPFLDPLPGEDGQKREDYRKTLQEIKKKTGGWKLAPRMVTDRNLTVMDSMLLCCSTQTRQRMLSNQSTFGAICGQCFQQILCGGARANGGLLCMGQFPMARATCGLLAHMLNTRGTSLASTFCLPPMRWNGVLQVDPAKAERSRKELLAEWEFVLRLEAANLQSPQQIPALKKIYWRMNSFIRVLAMAHQDDASRLCLVLLARQWLCTELYATALGTAG